MTGIGRSDALRSIATVLRLSGSKTSPEEIDIDAPLTGVFDVGPVAGVAGSLNAVEEIGGTTSLGVSDYASTTKAALYTTSSDTESKLKNLGLTPANSDVWLRNIALFILSTDVANFNAGQAYLYPVSDPNNATQATSDRYSQGVGYWNAVLGVVQEAGGSWSPAYNDADHLSLRPFVSALPRRIGEIRTRVVDDGVGTISWSYRLHLAFTPKGFLAPA